MLSTIPVVLCTVHCSLVYAPRLIAAAASSTDQFLPVTEHKSYHLEVMNSIYLRCVVREIV